MRKLPFPSHLLTIPCVIKLNLEGLNEQGEPEAAFTWSGKVIFSEKSRTTMTADQRIIRLEGQVIIKGDIAPAIETISDGEVSIKEKTYSVYRSERARNPDGSVHHTVLELM